jgi:hypothetical protein
MSAIIFRHLGRHFLHGGFSLAISGLDREGVFPESGP